MAWGTKRLWLRMAFLLVVGLCAGACSVWFWVIPQVIQNQVERATGGKTSFKSWWINTRTSGLSGLVIHEGRNAKSPIRFKAAQITTDVSLRAIFGQGLAPKLVQVIDPELILRFDANGKPLALPEVQKATNTGPLPKIQVTEGTLTIRQEGKPDLAIERFDGSITPDSSGMIAISASAQSPFWGKWDAAGTLSQTFTQGRVTLTQLEPIVVKQHTLKLLPFVPAMVADQVQVDGPLVAQLRFDLPGHNGEAANTPGHDAPRT